MISKNNTSLVLLDFDGLLVNTEHLHFQAYIAMCKNHGVDLNWSFPEYCLAAHYDNTRFLKKLLAEFPELQQYPWEKLYEEKKQLLLKLFDQGAVQLMPGVEAFLTHLHEEGIQSVVVTHSAKVLVESLKNKLKPLSLITHWVTREDYDHPKPHPECYYFAIKKFGGNSGKIIGFEDTPRGLAALTKTPAKAVWISGIDYPEKEEIVAKGVAHFPSFTAFNTQF